MFHYMVFFYVFVCCLCRAEILEFEDVLADKQDKYLSWRSEASNNKTLRLVDPNGRLLTAHLTLCVEPKDAKPNVSVLIENVRYSNDGPTDSVIFKLQGNYLGHFNSFLTWENGFGWNMFQNSGQIGQKLFLRKGRYGLTVSARTDIHGVELDTLSIRTEWQHPYLGLVCKKSFTRN